MSRLGARLALAAGCVAGCVALLVGCGSTTGGNEGPAAIVHGSGGDGAYAGVDVDPGFALPDATLITDAGRRVRLARDLDAPVRVFFYGYTQCPDICSVVLADLTVAVARLPSDLADDVSVVLVTSDPARDTPAALRTYLDRFNPDFTGLTGDLDTIVETALAMGVAIEEGPRLPSGGYEVAHGAELVGYLRDEGVVVWPQGTPVADLQADLTRMVLAARARTG